tara:strand:+ start:719 stop:1153 length:435 start_codon:yes stop_codon:yes gene_type:complete
MNSIMDNLTKALEMNPLVVEEQKEEQLPAVVEETNDAEQDFELARKNLQELAKKGNKALDELIMLAKNSEHPRAYEVVATLIKTLADTNKDLLDTRKKKIDIDKSRGVSPNNDAKTVNNNLFVGSTTELQKFLKERAKSLESDE